MKSKIALSVLLLTVAVWSMTQRGHDIHDGRFDLILDQNGKWIGGVHTQYQGQEFFSLERFGEGRMVILLRENEDCRAGRFVEVFEKDQKWHEGELTGVWLDEAFGYSYGY